MTGKRMPPASWDTSTGLGRLFFALHARTQIETAGALGVRQSAFSDCKRRGNIVTGDVLEKAMAVGITTEWIREGNAPMRKRESGSSIKCSAERYCPKTCPALEIARQVVRLIEQCPYMCKACARARPKT